MSTPNLIASMELFAQPAILYAHKRRIDHTKLVEVYTVTNKPDNFQMYFRRHLQNMLCLGIFVLLFSTAAFPWQNNKVELADVKFINLPNVNSSNPAKILLQSDNLAFPNAAVAVVATKRSGARLNCIELQLGNQNGYGRMVTKMSHTESCSNVSSDGSIRISTHQSTNSMLAVYVEIPEDAKLDFNVNNERVFLSRLSSPFAWREGRILNAKISNPASVILLAQGFDLAPQAAKIVENNGIHFANSEALKEHLLTPLQFHFKLATSVAKASPVLSVNISVDANGSATLTKPLPNPIDIQAPIEQYVRSLKFRPFLAGTQAISIRGALSFRQKEDGAIFGPVNLVSFESDKVEKGGPGACCQK